MAKQNSKPVNRQLILIVLLALIAVAAGAWLYQFFAGHKSSVAPGASLTQTATQGPGDGKACGNAPGRHKIDTVIVISEENRTWEKVGGAGFGTDSSPYEHNLAAQCAYFTADTETDTNDDSAQQYVGAWTGLNHTATHVFDDCTPSASCSYAGNNIFRVFRQAGIPHREYVEDATATCSAEGNASKHIPELYMWSDADRAACHAEVLPLSQFNFASPPSGFSFITPNLDNDGHDGSDATRDDWLADPGRLPALLDSSAYRSGRVLLELWWDEDAPRPNVFACYSCKSGLASAVDPHFSGESRLWLNLLGAPTGNLGAISNASDIRPVLGLP